MKRIWVVLALFAFTLVEALVTGRRIFYNLAALFGFTMLLSFLWALYNVNWVRFERKARSQRTQVGKLAEERFLLHNQGFLPKLWLEVRDHSDLPGYFASQVVTSLSPRKKRGWTTQTRCRRRGRFTLGPASVISGDPFGLFRREKLFSATSTMVVYPLTVGLPGFVLPVGVFPGRGQMQRRTHYITPNVASVREYYPGDSFNRIHWPSSAKQGRLIVKEFELDPTADVWLFLDMELSVQTDQTVREPVEREEPIALLSSSKRFALDPSTEEYSVTVAASLAQHFLSQNRSVGLAAYGQHREVIQSERGSRQLTKIMETLAVIQARGRIPLAQVLVAEGSRLRQNVSVIAISASTDPVWVGALRGLRRRGVHGMAVVIDGRSFGADEDSGAVVGTLADNGIPCYVVRKGDSLSRALSTPAGIG